MTNYTPAKDRLLVALAEWWNPGGEHKWRARMDAAARAVLEEEKGKGIVCPSCNLEPNYLHRCAVRRLEAELSELKRRVERVAKELRRCKPCDNCGMPVGQDYPGQWADILEGKERP